MSSTNFGSILIFASCVVGTCNIHYYTMWVSFFLMGGVLFKKHIDYIVCINVLFFSTTTMVRVGIFTLGGEF